MIKFVDAVLRHLNPSNGSSAPPDKPTVDLTLEHQHQLAESGRIIDAAMQKATAMLWVTGFVSAAGLIALLFVRVDPYGWQVSNPKLLDFASDMANMLLGLGLGLSVGSGFAWSQARRVINRLATVSGDAINSMDVHMAKLRQDMFELVTAAMPDNVDPHSALMVTDRVIEICHSLDAAALRAEIKYADGHGFATDKDASAAMHTMRVSHPAFSPDEKKLSAKWLTDNDIMPNASPIFDEGQEPETRH